MSQNAATIATHGLCASGPAHISAPAIYKLIFGALLGMVCNAEEYCDLFRRYRPGQRHQFRGSADDVYKLYRACRVGPDTKVEPSEQAAFYDAGPGSASGGGHFKIGWMRWLYNLASMATGLGITRNIVDCYAAIIALYEEGDRVFLIGSAAGRSVAGVMTYCGIPRRIASRQGLFSSTTASPLIDRTT